MNQNILLMDTRWCTSRCTASKIHVVLAVEYTAGVICNVETTFAKIREILYFSYIFIFESL